MRLKKKNLLLERKKHGYGYGTRTRNDTDMRTLNFSENRTQTGWGIH